MTCGYSCGGLRCGGWISTPQRRISAPLRPISTPISALASGVLVGENGRVARAVAWLAEVGGSAAPRELGAALGVGHTTQAKVTGELLAAGLATGNKMRVTLTPAGWARCDAGSGPGAGRVLDAALAGWPYAHRAFLELLCSVVVARYHLAAERPHGHLGFMAIGETGTGKSAMVALACHLFGLNRLAVRKQLYAVETPGSLLGRRERDGAGWRLVPSEAASLPLLLLDEFDNKGGERVRAVAWKFFQGETTARHEEQDWEIRPVPVLAANPPRAGDRYGLLRPEYRRRCAVLDTGYMRGRAEEIEDLMRERYYRTARPGALRLDQLLPPAGRLDDRGLAVLRTVRGALTEAGREEFPGIEALELAALGRLALMPAPDHRAAAYATALAYLQVTETVPGQAAEGWQTDTAAVRRWLGEEAAGPVMEAIERGRAGREHAARHARAAVTAHAQLGDELTRDRDALAERLRLALLDLQPRKLARLSTDHKAAAGGVRGVLQKLRRETQQCRSAVKLAELADRAGRPLADAAQLAQEVTAAADCVAQDRRERAARRQRETADRAREREQWAAWRRQQRAALDGIVSRAKPLEALYRRTATKQGESPLAILAEYGLVEYRPRPARPPVRGLARMREVLNNDPDGDWHITGTGGSFPGWPAACRALAKWGPGTQTVLAPALGQLHEAEDHYRAVLGVKPRSTRPSLT